MHLLPETHAPLLAITHLQGVHGAAICLQIDDCAAWTCDSSTQGKRRATANSTTSEGHVGIGWTTLAEGAGEVRGGADYVNWFERQNFC